MRVVIPIGLFITVAVAIGLLRFDLPVAANAASGTCGLAQPAFCDTFNAPSTNNGTRSGDLDGVVWGTSRATTSDNPTQGGFYTWVSTNRTTCGSQTAGPERDVVICNGQLAESTTDGGAATTLAMYPKQPFDFAGRTGTVVFDVNGVTHGPHGAWPAFAISDQPVPAPTGGMDVPRNGFGFTLSGVCSVNGGNRNGITVDTMWTTSNYQPKIQASVGTGCVLQPTSDTSLNHFEVRISPSSVQVWASDPGGTGLRQIATGTFSMPLTRGLIWIQDQHYNGNKDSAQGTQTYVWDNVGFDGPVLPRDLGFDVLDANHTGTSAGNLGYLVWQANPSTFPIAGVHNTAGATGALLVFNFWPHNQDSWTYSVNGHPAHQFPWPYGANGQTFTSQTLGVPIPMNEVQDGTNTIKMNSSEGFVSVANISLILVGAGGGGSNANGGGLPSATPTDTAVVVGTATSTPTNTPVVAGTPTPTATPTNTPVVASTLTPTATPTSTLGTPATPTRTPILSREPSPTPTLTATEHHEPSATPPCKRDGYGKASVANSSEHAEEPTRQPMPCR